MAHSFPFSAPTSKVVEVVEVGADIDDIDDMPCRGPGEPQGGLVAELADIDDDDPDEVLWGGVIRDLK